jgi:hypothetical protein
MRLRRRPEPVVVEPVERPFGPTAVIVTRGDVDLRPALEAIPKEWPRVIWDNSKRSEDLKVYGHFAALAEVQTEYVYMQDDDAVCPAAALLEHWDEGLHGDKILLNEADDQTPWISWGAIFHRDLPAPAIQRYVDAYGMGDDVLLWCDMIFSTLTPWVNVDLGWKNLAWARADNRMCQVPTHYQEQQRVRKNCLALTAVTA